MWLVDPISDSTVVGALNPRKLRSLKVKYENYILFKDNMGEIAQNVSSEGRERKIQLKWSK